MTAATTTVVVIINAVFCLYYFFYVVFFSQKYRPNGDKSYTAMWEYNNGTLKPFMYYGEKCIGTSDYGEFASEWMDSDSHRPQILSEKYTRTAIAIIYCSDGLYYATQFFVG